MCIVNLGVLSDLVCALLNRGIGRGVVLFERSQECNPNASFEPSFWYKIQLSYLMCCYQSYYCCL